MNCRRFQNNLYEYLEESLSPRAQAAAEKHLAECAVCRKVLQTQRRVGQLVSAKLRETAERLQLPPEVGQRVLAALDEERTQPTRLAAPPWGQGAVLFWRRPAWPLAAAASVLLLTAGLYFFIRAPGPGTTYPPAHRARADIVVQLSYVVPTYTFRQEGGFVVDALTCHTNVVNERLGPQASRAD